MNKYLQLMNFQNSGKPQNDKNSEFPGESTTTGFYSICMEETEY